MQNKPSADSLYAHFAENADRSEMVPISAEEMPEPYRQLLVHTHHMTVTIEGFYGQAVNVKVLESVQSGDKYARKILLSLRESGEVVQFGIVAIDLAVLAPDVRQQIVEGKTPLGRVLIQNGVLRHIQPAGYFRVTPSAKLSKWLGMREPKTTYGRLGVIFTDNHPAIEVMEILTPIPNR